MTHADTLRGMAKTFMIVGSHERVDTCLAGADALDTLIKVQKVAELLDQMAEDNRKLTHLDWVRDRAEGQAHSYAKAAEIIREATGGTE